MNNLKEVKEFTILEDTFDKLPTTNIDGKRYYTTPDGNNYPSVTSVTGLASKKGIVELRKLVGEKTANKISTQASGHGTKVHHLIEDYINNDDFNSKYIKSMPTTQYAFNTIRPLLNQIGTVHALEASLYSDELQLAGRVDCIADWHGKLAVIDFKTSAKPKKPEYITNYFMQTTAYAKMFEERTGKPVDQVVILIAVADGNSQLFIETPNEKWVQKLQSYRQEYRELYGK